MSLTEKCGERNKLKSERDYIPIEEIDQSKFRIFEVRFDYHGHVWTHEIRAKDWEDAWYMSNKIAEQIQKRAIYEVDSIVEFPSGKIIYEYETFED